VALAVSAPDSATAGARWDSNAEGWDGGGLGGYGGYGMGAASLLETQRAAGGAVVTFSDVQLQRLSLAAARVDAHLVLLQYLLGRQELCVNAPADGWAVGVTAGCRELEARILAVLVQMRNVWVWGVQRQIATAADYLLKTSPLASLAPVPASPAHTRTPAPSPTPSPTPHLPAKTPPHPPPPTANSVVTDCGTRRRLDSELLARALWEQCKDALRHEEGFDSAYSLDSTSTSSTPPANSSTRPTTEQPSSADKGLSREHVGSGVGEWEWAAPGRGAAFLRASSLVWVAQQLGHGEGWVEGGGGSVWLGAAVALLEQSPYDLKTLGAQLTLALLLRADRHNFLKSQLAIQCTLYSEYRADV